MKVLRIWNKIRLSKLLIIYSFLIILRQTILPFNSLKACIESDHPINTGRLRECKPYAAGV